MSSLCHFWALWGGAWPLCPLPLGPPISISRCQFGLYSGISPLADLGGGGAAANRANVSLWPGEKPFCPPPPLQSRYSTKTVFGRAKRCHFYRLAEFGRPLAGWIRQCIFCDGRPNRLRVLHRAAWRGNGSATWR